MALSPLPRLRAIVLASLGLLAALAAAGLWAGSAPPAENPADAARSVAGAALDKLPRLFVENRGQVDGRAGLYLAGADTSVYFTGDGLRLSLTDRTLGKGRYGVGLDFVGARAGAEPVGRGRTPATLSFFKGPRSQWKTAVPTYSAVAYEDLWPGIDLVYSGSGSRLKYSFLVEPGADPAAIDLAWRGATGLAVDARGALSVSTPAGVVRDGAPYSYQVVDGRRRKVESSYALAAGHRYGFRLGSYDRSEPLVIDPAVLVYSGFIGGSGDEEINNVALDGSGNLYVTGPTTSPSFPGVGPDGSFNGGLNDGLVAKVRADGSGLVYAGFIGGADFDNPINIAVDAAGAAYVSGSTGSSESEGFPVATGPDLTYNGGPQDAFVAKVAPSGSELAYAGYIGGAGGTGESPADPNEQANGIDVDATGAAYVAGFTQSDESTFPDGDGFGAIPGYDTTFNSITPPPPLPTPPDLWSAKVNPLGTGLDYATYLGGGGADAGTGVAVDATGVYLNTFTSSNSDPQGMMNPFGGFPVSAGAFDTTFNGPPGPGPPADAGAAKLSLTGTTLIYSTYLGGAGIEQPFGNTVDGSGNAYITGRTNSDEASFPDGDGFGAIPGFDQTLSPGPGDPPPDDGFVVKLNAAGTALTYATYVGGSGAEVPIGIGLDGSARATIGGTTGSTQASFPATNGPDSSYNGGPADAFVARLNAAGTALDFAGFVGGSLDDSGLGMAVDASGNAYLGGSTDSDQCAGFPTAVGPDPTFNGAFGSVDAFVAKIDPTGASAGPRPNPIPGCPAPPPPRPVAPGVAAFRGCPAASTNVIRGSAAGETVNGTAAGDRIFAGAGNDRVAARGGDDCVDLGAGRDRGTGSTGRDLMLGGSGGDRVAGNADNDRISGNSGNDRLAGAGGRDRLSGGSGRDRISGGSSNDRVTGGGGADRIAGDSGNDRLSGNSGSDRITGGRGRDRIVAGSGNDRIRARDGVRDRISCGRGRDRVVADQVDRVARSCDRVTVVVAGSAGAATAPRAAVILVAAGCLGLLRRRRRAGLPSGVSSD